MRQARLCGVLCAGLLAPIITRAHTPSFNFCGAPPGGLDGRVQEISPDGLIAVGFNDLDTSRTAGFTWTRQGGRSDFGLLPGMPFATIPTGVTSSGVAAGSYVDLSNPPSALYRAFRWTGSGPLQNLGVL